MNEDQERTEFEAAAHAHYLTERSKRRIKDDFDEPATLENLMWRQPSGEYGVLIYNAAWWAWKARAATVPASHAPAVADGSTPGEWFVRKHFRDGVLRDAFVSAPDCQGLAYDAEILSDDEYRDTPEDADAGIKRKVADCELIVAAVKAYRAAPGGADSL